MTSRGTSTIFFDEYGNFFSVAGLVEEGRHHPIEMWAMAQFNYGDSFDKLPGKDYKRTKVIVSRGERITRAEAVNTLADDLRLMSRNRADESNERQLQDLFEAAGKVPKPQEKK